MSHNSSITSIPLPVPGLAAALVGSLVMLSSPVIAQHTHLEVGVDTQEQGGILEWHNGDEFSTSSGYVKALTPATSGRYQGYYAGNITLVALSSEGHGPIEGSFVRASIVSVEGPSGGSFGFWESVDLGGSTAPTFVIPTGSQGGAWNFELSDRREGAGNPGADPFGHIHGRQFTADTLGEYTVGFRAWDISVNGFEGGPFHKPSGILYVKFAAVPEPSLMALGVLGGGFLWMSRRKRA